MCCDSWIIFLFKKKGWILISVTLLLVTIPFFFCGTTATKFRHSTIEHRDGVMNLPTLALRFAPRLYLHPDEPFGILGVFPVFHPVKPIIAYHIFFEDDALFTGRGKELDHEILWVEYDPITLKVSDVATLWHRTVLRTDTCLMNAKVSQQRPLVFIQWGQHGVLPLGWEKLQTLRPSAELLLYYSLVRTVARIPGFQKSDAPAIFKGSYREYLRFTKEVDTAYYVKIQKIIVAEYSAEELKSRLKQTFSLKKEWPFWSPTN